MRSDKELRLEELQREHAKHIKILETSPKDNDPEWIKAINRSRKELQKIEAEIKKLRE